MGGGPLPHFFSSENLLVRVKLSHPPNFNFLGKPLLGEKYVEGKKERKKKKKKERIMPSLVATTSALARKPCVSTHYVRTKIWEGQTATGRSRIGFGYFSPIWSDSPLSHWLDVLYHNLSQILIIFIFKNKYIYIDKNEDDEETIRLSI